MVFKVKKWNHILVEGYCMANVDYLAKHSKWVYAYEADKEPSEWKKEPNSQYDPKIKPDKKPEYCNKHVGINCLQDGDMCPHFAFCPAEKKVKKKFRKIIRKYYK